MFFFVMSIRCIYGLIHSAIFVKYAYNFMFIFELSVGNITDWKNITYLYLISKVLLIECRPASESLVRFLDALP